MAIEVLGWDTWQARAAAHAARVEAFVAPHLTRRRDGVKHPVHDFLFTYYSQRPAQLRRWHPGYGVALAGGSSYALLKGYDGEPATVTASYLDSQRPLIASIRALLVATAGRPANFGCFGLHEWAMVYRADETRHDWPLRLGRDGTDAVVESHRIGCSHFDAFRFFTPPARPLNTLQPGRDDRVALEQPGCLHAGMDLYKHAFRLSPLVCSDLVADCFELARDIRILDMRAAPYDLADLGFSAVRIETLEGKQEYSAAQRQFAERAAPIRQSLMDECERLLSSAFPMNSRATGGRTSAAPVAPLSAPGSSVRRSPVHPFQGADMPTILNPYISFKDNAREALEFYQSVLGGELTVNTFGEYGDPSAPGADNVMHGQLTSAAGLTLMAADTPPDMQWNPGDNISISLSGDDAAELKGYWEGLGDGGKVTVPLEKQMWGDEFGMLVDKFGIIWLVNIAGEQQG